MTDEQNQHSAAAILEAQSEYRHDLGDRLTAKANEEANIDPEAAESEDR